MVSIPPEEGRGEWLKAGNHLRIISSSFFIQKREVPRGGQGVERVASSVVQNVNPIQEKSLMRNFRCTISSV
ncbi:fimbrial assembly family protein [Anopheles sinensis]|uniref:Fimbrial assembly family protein n=1 Tax=Anopheles sinensis TaxID=74873 RepID=A0A084WA80_ANOSI|nr:fimbrial assembly family protein [Anopheles sinensis]